MTSSDAVHAIDRRVGEALNRRRLAAALELAELAEKTKLSVMEIARYESGRSRPSATSLLAISQALGVSIAEIFGVATV
jgi:transcriptional regulator with XRE-family HTH domain